MQKDLIYSLFSALTFSIWFDQNKYELQIIFKEFVISQISFKAPAVFELD